MEASRNGGSIQATVIDFSKPEAVPEYAFSSFLAYGPLRPWTLNGCE